MKKTTLFFAILLLPFFLMAQQTRSVKVAALATYDPNPQSSLCAERGHVMGSEYTSTSLDCREFRVLDTQDSTWLVRPPCEIRHYTCLRCGSLVSEEGQDVRWIIWWRGLLPENRKTIFKF